MVLEPQLNWVNRVLKVRKVLLVHVVERVLLEYFTIEDLKDFKVVLVVKVGKVTRDIGVIKETHLKEGTQEFRVSKVFKVMMVQLDLQGVLLKKDTEVIRAHKDFRVLKEIREFLVPLDNP